MSPTGTRSRQIEQRLGQRTAEFDAARLSGRAAVGEVVRRGRRRLLAVRLLSGVATTAVVASGATVLPSLLTDEPAPPAILESPDRQQPPAVPEPAETATDDAAAPVDDGWSTATWSIVEKPSDDPTKEPDPEPDQPVAKPKAPEPKVADPAPKPQPSEKASEPAPETKTSEPAPEPKTSEPAPEPKTSEPVSAFTAHQMHEASDAEPPANAYWGTAKPGADVKIWSEYGWAITTVPETGEWEVHVTFPDAPPGTTTFPVKAKNLHTGQHVVFEFTTHRGEAVAFTAHQAHDVVDGDPPTNVYWGTAQPGTEIKVWSEYGWAVTTVAETGEWEVHVTFADAPAGTATFAVKAKNLHTGQHVVFELTTVRPEPSPDPSPDPSPEPDPSPDGA